MIKIVPIKRVTKKACASKFLLIKRVKHVINNEIKDNIKGINNFARKISLIFTGIYL